MPAIEGEALPHTVWPEPAVELNRRTLYHECSEITPLAGLLRAPFTLGAAIDDPLRHFKPLFRSPHRFVLPD